jgi:hypothetical protein
MQSRYAIWLVSSAILVAFSSCGPSTSGTSRTGDGRTGGVTASPTPEISTNDTTSTPTDSMPAVSPTVSKSAVPQTDPTKTAASPTSKAPADTPTPRPSSTRPSESAPPPNVHFVAAVSTKTWGDQPFMVRASATRGARVRYAASGTCRVDARSGRVTLISVGTCTINATAVEDSRAQDTLGFKVIQARPVIRFGDRSTSFTRPFNFPLGATVTRRIQLRYQVLRGQGGAYNDDACVVVNGNLRFSQNPQLASACLVEVSAAKRSPNYATPKPVRGLVSIGFPSWQVDVPPVPVVHWSKLAGGRLKVPVHEDSGDAFSMSVWPNSAGGSADGCNFVGTSPGSPSPPGTTRYIVTLELSKPTDAGYTCSLLAEAGPLDYAGGKASDPFTITVVP